MMCKKILKSQVCKLVIMQCNMIPIMKWKYENSFIHDLSSKTYHNLNEQELSHLSFLLNSKKIFVNVSHHHCQYLMIQNFLTDWNKVSSNSQIRAGQKTLFLFKREHHTPNFSNCCCCCCCGQLSNLFPQQQQQFEKLEVRCSRLKKLGFFSSLIELRRHW